MPNHKDSTKQQVVCFHDGECPLCRIEINAMQKLDKAKAVKWVDINTGKAALEAAGITYKQAMERIHVVDEHGTMQTGVAGFIEVWKRLPYYRRLAWAVERIPFLLPLLEFCYQLFARYRLPLTGKKRLH